MTGQRRSSRYACVAGMLTLLVVSTSWAQTPGPLNAITDVPGIEVGNFTSADATSGAATGTTVVIARGGGATGGVSQRGGAPGTRETDLLRPENLVEKVNAVVLSGGSAYGLAAADGAMLCLEAQGAGFPGGSWSGRADRAVRDPLRSGALRPILAPTQCVVRDGGLPGREGRRR